VDPDLLTRTSWVDAHTAYVQVTRGKADGNRRALWLRWQLQRRLFRAGCFIQLHSGKVLFLGLLLLSLCCVGLKTVSLETSVDKLWVEAGGRLSHELAYTMKWLGEGSGTTYELLIQTPRVGNTGASGPGVLSTSSLLQHLEAVKAATKLTVEINDVTFSFNDLCYATGFPNFDDNSVMNQILHNLQACVIITPLDCFWEGSKLLGPDHPVYIPFLPEKFVTWTNLNPRNAVEILGEQHVLHFPVEQLKQMLTQAGIEDGYQSKACLNPYDPECPMTAPNHATKQLPDVGAALTGGCSGVSTKYTHWEEDLIVGGTYHGKTGQLMSANAIQSLLQLMGERDLYDFHRDTNKVLYMTDWSVSKARQVLDAWRRKFAQTVLASQNASASDDVYAMSSLDLDDVMDDFSQISLVRVVVGCLLMCVYACVSLAKLSNTVQSQATVGLIGVLLVILSVAAGLGICSVVGIKFNAATTQILPFLALGLGVDDVFLMAHTFAQVADKPAIIYHEITGECLKRVGVTVLLTSLCNSCAFFLASIIPIPAMRAFCLQCAILVLFNMATVMFVYPAVVSLDLFRRQKSRMDFFCCFTWETLPGEQNLPSSSSTAAEARFTCVRQSHSASSQHQPGRLSRDTITRIQDDGRYPVTSLIPCDISSSRHLEHAEAGLCPSQYLSANLPQRLSSSKCQCCSCDNCLRLKRKLTRWSLTKFARDVYARLLQNTVFKIVVVCFFVVLALASAIGILRVRDGLDITDVVPRDTNEHEFLRAQSKYFGFYNFYAVTQNDFDYTSAESQKLLFSYHQAFLKIDNIIKKEDGSLPDFWLQKFRAWLIDVQKTFDNDVAAGFITRDGWTNNATAIGRLGYKLILQTGDTDHVIDRHRFDNGRLVSSNGIIYPPAFYIYLTAWTSNDAMAYDTSMAALRPTPKNWLHDEYDRELKIPKSQPLAYAQLAFYLHNLGDTESVTSTIKDVRAICESFAARGLPNYPQGIIFTFWEQYVNLRFYLLLTLIAVLVAIFVVLSITLLNPWAASIVVVVIGLIVVELFGIMGLIGIKLSAIPAVILVITAGVSVEFTVHVCVSFLTSIGSSRHKRVTLTLESVFAPITHGAVSTLLGVIMLVGSQFDFIIRYFFVILALLVVLGLLNGLLLLPVLLLTIGPSSEVRPLDNGDHIPLPSPKLHPKKSKSSSSGNRRRQVRGGRRLAYHARTADPEHALSTIAEESSQHHASSTSVHGGGDTSSVVSVDVLPEVVVETLPAQPPPYSGIPLSGVGGATGGCPTCCITRLHGAPTTTSTTTTTTTTTGSSSSGHHVTTIRTTARVKVEVHTPVPIISHSSPDFKSKKRKRPRMMQEDFNDFAVVDSSLDSSIDSC
jgi:EST family sterol transporter